MSIKDSDLFDEIEDAQDLIDEVDLPIEERVAFSKEIKESIREEIDKIPVGKIVSSLLEKEVSNQDKKTNQLKESLTSNISQTKKDIEKKVEKIENSVSDLTKKLNDKYSDLKTNLLNQPRYQFGGFAPPNPLDHSGEFLTNTAGTWDSIAWSAVNAQVDIGDIIGSGTPRSVLFIDDSGNLDDIYNADFLGGVLDGDTNPYTGTGLTPSGLQVKRTIGELSEATEGSGFYMKGISSDLTDNNAITGTVGDMVYNIYSYYASNIGTHTDTVNWTDGAVQYFSYYGLINNSITITGLNYPLFNTGLDIQVSPTIVFNNAGGAYNFGNIGGRFLVLPTITLTAGTLAWVDYGLYVAVQGNTSGTSTGYGLFMSVQSYDTNWGVYISSVTDSYTNGTWGIKQIAITAYLHLGAGTASASTSPLKFTSGTLNTVPELGAVEFLTDRLYISTAGTRYPIIQGSIGLTGGTTIIGGTATTDDLILQSTSGNAGAGADIIFKTGNAGATEGARMLFDGTFSLFGISIAAPTSFLHVNGVAPASVSSTPGTNATAVLTVLGPAGGATTNTASPVGGVGSLWTITGGTGGAANSGTSGTATSGIGGAATVAAGTGGANSSSNASVTSKGGAGGLMTINGGGGGSGTNSTSGGSATGGNGGGVTISCGSGATGTGTGTSTATGGNGGNFTVTAGSGGTPSTSTTLIIGTAGTISITGGTGASPSSASTTAGNGGTATFSGGTGGGNSSGASGGGGNITVQGGAGGGTFTSTAGNGGTISCQGGTGGSGSGPTAGSGGNASFSGGTGGTANTTNANGGTITCQGGSGGGVSPNAGGNGGNSTFQGGGGGSSTGSAAGTGGNASLLGGTGGTPSSTATAGSAGIITVKGGIGGGGATSINGAAGGAVTVSGGTGGATTTGTSGTGGGLTLTGGIAGTNSGGTSGAGGIITFQTAVTTSLTTAGNIDKNGRWFLGGSTTATAVLHLAAGAAAASSGPLKFTSGTNLTTAEAGAMEYNGTNLFFTRTGTTRENVLVAVDNAAAPSTSVGVAIVNFYGSSATNFLGTPDRWVSVNIAGAVYKIPMYN